MHISEFDLQPLMENELIKIQPLEKEDFEALYEVASDPLIWEQHPERDRYKREVFEKFFEGAIGSGGAFLILNNKTGNVIGSTRFYDLNEAEKSVAIGYTFLARDHWGTAYNRALKELMLDHAFKFFDTINFHIGANNIRSQKAVEKLGAKKTGHAKMKFKGREKELNYIFRIDKKKWTDSLNNSFK